MARQKKDRMDYAAGTDVFSPEESPDGRAELTPASTEGKQGGKQRLADRKAQPDKERTGGRSADSLSGDADKQLHSSLLCARRDYKDTLFRMIFNDRAHLLALYNAVNQTAYTDPEQLKIVTLENAIYMNMKNDLAFLLDFKLNLYEHQSTWNPNMPLRDLFYAAREYEKLIQESSLYSSWPLKIPTPRFIVLYNGTERKEERVVLKLSDSFEKPTLELELTVTVLNINSGFNRELLDACQLLGEYSLYVARVRKYAETMKLDEAVELAVSSCIDEGILKKFLIHYRAEAISMSIFEYNEERERELLRKAEFEYGWEQGIEQGIQQGVKQGIEQGARQALQQGILAVIKTCQQLSASKTTTLQNLKTQFSLSDEEANEYLRLYWK